MPFRSDETYDRLAFENVDCATSITGLQFYKCVFINCSFQGVRFSDCSFDECHFLRCNLSLVEMNGAQFSGVAFEDCKMLGINWSGTGGFLSASYSGCIMDHNVFADMNLSKYVFTSCSFVSATFSNTKLMRAVFDDCDLHQCMFHKADLSRASFVTSRNYYMNAETNTLHKTAFSLPEAVSLLANLDIVLK